MVGIHWKCSHHPEVPYRGLCRGCGAPLCHTCFELHSPPLCISCALRKYNAARVSAALGLVLLVAGFVIDYATTDMSSIPTPLTNGIQLALLFFAVKLAITVILGALEAFGISWSDYLDTDYQGRMSILVFISIIFCRRRDGILSWAHHAAGSNSLLWLRACQQHRQDARLAAARPLGQA